MEQKWNMAEITKLYTDKNVLKLPVQKNVQTYKDKHQPYLKIIVRPSGKKCYFLRTKVDGKDIKRKLGEVGEIQVASVRLLATRMLKELKQPLANNSVAQNSVSPQYLSINDIFSLYLENELKHRETIAGRKHSLEIVYENHVRTAIGDCLVSRITKKSARNFLKKLEVKGYSVHNKVVSVLKAAFNYVIDFEEELGVFQNPFARVKKMKGVVRSRYLTHEEAGRLLNALKEVKDQDVADIYRLALFTGARLSNVKSMQWRDISLSSAIWSIPSTLTKTSVPYEIPLHSYVIEILKARQLKHKQTEFVFPARNKSKYGYITGGDKVWKTAIKIADLYHPNPNIRPRPHDLRRTFATWQIQSGADISVVSKALCHTSLKHTIIYAHTNVDQVRSAIDGAFKGFV